MKLGKENIRGNMPFSSPEWRWQRAQVIWGDQKMSISLEPDLEVRNAYYFLKKVLLCSSDYEWDKLCNAEPDNCMALSFWIDPVRFTPAGATNRPDVFEVRRQAAIESYLLTGASADVVAKKVGITKEAVKRYESWFYDFRDKVDRMDWMPTYAMRGDVAGTSGCSFEHFIRAQAWQYGVEAVDDLLRGVGYSDATIKNLRRDVFSHLGKGGSIASRNIYHQATLMEALGRQTELHDRIKEMEIMAGKDYKSNEEKQYAERAESELASYAWCVVSVPEAVEAAIPKVEKRIAVQLGLSTDYSEHRPSD